ncbi:MAG: YjbQ family protein [Nitrospirae bacterium]|nr:YjbQ family protein [Nitrospirota bacterium]
MLKTINISTHSRSELIDITEKVREAISNAEIKNGICVVYVPHTTAGVLINEGADPSVQRDIEKTFSRLIPHQGDYRHSEGNSDAHIKSVMTGASQSVIIDNGMLLLGTWQAVFLAEFDGPRQRKIIIKIIGESR